jgi:hypothetical protein
MKLVMRPKVLIVLDPQMISVLGSNPAKSFKYVFASFLLYM